jgi:preprotein translocase subunit SecY
MSIFALSISPYITASIVIQLASAFIKPLSNIANDGSVGKQKMERITMCASVVIAIVEALILAIGLGKNGLFINYSWRSVLIATILWTMGACLLTWVGQTISKKLFGNGISLILLFNILTTFPEDIINIFNSVIPNQNIWVKITIGVAIAVSFILVFAYVVILNRAEKRIKITNSGKAGIRMADANDNILPLKLNVGGIMPIIFASSLMSFPILISQLFKITPGSTIETVLKCCSQSNWFDLENPIYTLGVLFYIPTTFLFAYLYSRINFNANDIANRMKMNGSVVNGLRPGSPTAEYLKKQHKSILWIGTTMMMIIALLPTFISGIFNIAGLGFGGTTLIIIVGTILELRNTIEAQTASVTYKSLFKRKGGEV